MNRCIFPVIRLCDRGASFVIDLFTNTFDRKWNANGRDEAMHTTGISIAFQCLNIKSVVFSPPSTRSALAHFVSTALSIMHMHTRPPQQYTNIIIITLALRFYCCVYLCSVHGHDRTRAHVCTSIQKKRWESTERKKITYSAPHTI